MNAELYITKASLQISKGEIDKAVDSMMKAIEIGNDMISVTQAHCFLGEYYFVNQDYVLSKENFHILNLKDGKPIVTPSQDMVLGNYYITMEKAGLEGEGRVFKNPMDALMAYERREITLQTRIAIKADAFKHKILMDNLSAFSWQDFVKQVEHL